MNILHGAGRVVTRFADATTTAAGSLGSAAVKGVVGGVQGTAAGVKNGLSTGSNSTPAAVLTFAAIGAAGLVEWPVLAAVGGTALLVHQLHQRSSGNTQQPAAVVSAPAPNAARATKSPRPAAKTAARTPTRSTRRSPATRRTSV